MPAASRLVDCYMENRSMFIFWNLSSLNCLWRKKNPNIYFMGVGILSVIWILMKLSILARMVGSVLPVLHQPLCCLTCCKHSKPKWIFSSSLHRRYDLGFFPSRSSVRPGSNMNLFLYQSSRFWFTVPGQIWANSRPAQGWINWVQASPDSPRRTCRQDSRQWRGEEEHGGMH